MSDYTTITLIVILLFFSAIFSCSETVYTYVKKETLAHLKEKGRAFADMAYKLVKTRASVIETILIGNNISNTFASALTTGLLVAKFGEIGILIAACGMTVIIVLFMEILPKVYGLRHPESLSLVLAPIIRLFVIIFSPLTVVTRFFSRRDSQHGEFVQSSDLKVPLREEIRHLIGNQQQEDLKKEEQDMLEGILELREVDVEDIMVHRSEIEAIDIGQEYSDILQAILTSKHNLLPVWENEVDNIIGIISKKSVLQAVSRSNQANKLEADDIDFRALLRDAWFVPDNTSLMVQLQAFIKRRAYFCLVVDEYGTLMGMVTLSDILEEIVGQIHEETQKEYIITPNADGSLDVLAQTAIRDLNRQFDWDLPEDESTVAGLILSETHAIPPKESEITIPGYKFKILSSKRSKIKRVQIRKLDK